MKQPGDVIGRFQVERLLGEGGIAQVYAVRHRQLGTLHALKLLTIQRRGLAARLLQEGRIQAQLRHPHVVAVTDVVEHEGQIGLIMEYIQGFSLDACLKEGGAMPTDDALALFRQIIEGVGAAHDAGVLHRDLKPGNILLTTEGDSVVAKVADFGIAKIATEGMESDGMTLGGTAMGTPGYMAPEQITDSANVDARADVFALGTILYEMLSGTRAFGRGDMLGILNRTSEGTYTPLVAMVPGLPLHISRAVDTALALKPAERFSSCRQFANALGVVVVQSTPSLLASLPSIPPTESPNPTLMPMTAERTGDHPSEQTWHPDEAGRSTGPTEMLEAPEPQRRPAYTPPPPTPRTDLHTHGPAGTIDPEVPTDLPADPPTEEELNSRFGLDGADVEIDGQLPRAHFQTATAAPPTNPTPLPAEETEEVERSEHEQPGMHVDPSDAGQLIYELVWPLLRALYNTGRYLTFPVIGVLLVGLLTAQMGQTELNDIESDVELTETQLGHAIEAALPLYSELITMGAREAVLAPFLDRYQRSEDAISRYNAALELTDAMLQELRVLPPTADVAQIQRRREVEVQLNHMRSQYDTWARNMGAWQDSAGGMKGTLAIRAGLAAPPPGWEDGQD